jgi:hypothetical protein
MLKRGVSDRFQDICQVSIRNFDWLSFTLLWSPSPILHPTRLKPLDLTIKDVFLIYLIFNSLMKEFKTFEVNYISMNDKWTFIKFIAMCVQEEEMIKRNNGDVDSVNMAKHHQKINNFAPKLYVPKKEDK